MSVPEQYDIVLCETSWYDLLYMIHTLAKNSGCIVSQQIKNNSYFKKSFSTACNRWEFVNFTYTLLYFAFILIDILFKVIICMFMLFINLLSEFSVIWIIDISSIHSLTFNSLILYLLSMIYIKKNPYISNRIYKLFV